MDNHYRRSSPLRLRKGTRVSNPLGAALKAAAVINETLSTMAANPNSGSSGGSLNRQARRLYIGNIPFGTSNEDMLDFFEKNMVECNFVNEPGHPVIGCQINPEKNFAFLEFRSVEETSHAISLDGIQFKGQALKIRRPHDYQPSSEPTSMLGSHMLNILAASGDESKSGVSSVVADSPNKIYIGSIPSHLNDDQLRELLSTFGKLKAFNLVKDPSTGQSKGYAFCEYADSSITDKVILALPTLDLGDKKLVVQRASVGSKAGSLLTGNHLLNSQGINAVTVQIPGIQNISKMPRVLSPVLCLMNIVDEDELRDDKEFREIFEDIEEECLKYGKVISIKIPRPASLPSQISNDMKPPAPPPVPGIGKVFVEFESPTEAQRASEKLSGRQFGNKYCLTSFFDHDRFKTDEF